MLEDGPGGDHVEAPRLVLTFFREPRVRDLDAARVGGLLGEWFDPRGLPAELAHLDEEVTARGADVEHPAGRPGDVPRLVSIPLQQRVTLLVIPGHVVAPDLRGRRPRI